MENPTIVLGVCGSIAAYKAADLVSKLTQRQIHVQTMMTRSACELVQPQTFFTLSRLPVITDLWNTQRWQPEHIALAERATLLVIAPATANMIGKIANGIGDDALSTYALSHTGPILIVPAMNPRMWNNPIVQENCQRLRQRGIIILEPNTGHVACGESGKGRFPEVPQIVDFIMAVLACQTLKNQAPTSRPKVLITAGPTRESWDPVRFLTNHSSGKMGFALATVAAALNYDVTLIAGPVQCTTPLNCRRINVLTAEDMKNAVLQEIEQTDILLMCAAVADYRIANVQSQKIKKSDAMSLQLERTADILETIKPLKKESQRFIGFAAETESVNDYAAAKLQRKKLDMIVANDVSRNDIGFGTDTNEVTLITPQGTTHIDKCSKIEIAAHIFNKITSELL